MRSKTKIINIKYTRPMKKLLLLLTTVTVLSACSKKDDTGIDNNCGTILLIEKQSQLNDGGVEESWAGTSCGDGFEALKKQVELTGEDGTIFYKGQTRAKVKYLVARQGSNYILYFRYESNNIPQSSIEYWENKGYTVTIQELTGLEKAIY